MDFLRAKQSGVRPCRTRTTTSAVTPLRAPTGALRRTIIRVGAPIVAVDVLWSLRGFGRIPRFSGVRPSFDPNIEATQPPRFDGSHQRKAQRFALWKLVAQSLAERFLARLRRRASISVSGAFAGSSMIVIATFTVECPLLLTSTCLPAYASRSAPTTSEFRRHSIRRYASPATARPSTPI